MTDPAPTADERPSALYVRLPAREARLLDRAAFERRVSKRELVTEMVRRSLDEGDRRVRVAPPETIAVGRVDLPASPPAEVLTPDEAGALLQVEPDALLALAEAGGIPGRRIGSDWRFSRTALLAWLAGPETGPRRT